MTSDLILKIEHMAYGGDAIGRTPAGAEEGSGRAVFVPFALPGETVRLRVVEEKRGRLCGELLEVLEPSPERIQPRCPHFGECGGCHYQQIGYEDQLQVKQAVLADQLRRIGRIENPPLLPIVPAPAAWNYRNHVQFHPLPEGGLGLLRAGSHTPLAVRECHLPERALNELWPTLDLEPGLELDRVALRLGAGGELMLVLESPQPPEMELEADLSVVHLLNGEAVVMAGSDHLFMEVQGRAFRVSAASFFQVNTAMAARLVDHLLTSLQLSPKDTLLDLYCGVGLFSAFLAPRVGRLAEIELSPSACEDFSYNLDEFDNVELYQAPAEQALPALQIEAQAVLVDPPRAGLEKRVLEALVEKQPAQIAYVSCDPATLARDAGRLIAAGYRLRQVTPFDLFPQTYHIESVSLFERGDK